MGEVEGMMMVVVSCGGLFELSGLAALLLFTLYTYKHITIQAHTHAAPCPPSPINLNHTPALAGAFIHFPCAAAIPSTPLSCPPVNPGTSP